MKHNIEPRWSARLLSKYDHSIRDISRTIRKSRSFVERWSVRENMDRQPGSGRPTKLTRSVLKQIISQASGARHMSSRQVARKMHLSQTTVLKALHASNLHPYHPRKRPLLSKKNQKSRLTIAKQYKNEDWHRVLFIDEKKVSAFQRPNSKNDIIWAPVGTDVPPTPTVKKSVSLNVAAGVSYNGKTSIHIFKENMDQHIFRDILHTTIIPGGNKLLGANWKLYMDNDPKHKSKLCMDFLHEKQIDHIPTPAQSPDLNVVEDVWSMLVNNMKNKFPNSAKQLKKSIENAWKKIPQIHIQNSIDSVSYRLELVRKEKGGHIKYG